MVMINRLSDYVGHAYVEGLYRQTKVVRRTAENGQSELVALLEDCSGEVYCRKWTFGMAYPIVATNNIFLCRMRVGLVSGKVVAELISCNPKWHFHPPALQLLSRSSMPLPEMAMALKELIERCPISALQDFMNTIFMDENIALPFLRLPASREHHHAFPGGLVQHSLEVATIVQHSLWDASEDELWLAIVAALFHDIGKLKVFKPGGKKTPIGFVIDHDMLTLEILSQALNQLDSIWPDGAIALRYLLTRSSKTTHRPLMPCALAIEYADKMSSAQNTQHQAFNQKPNWQRFAKLDVKGPPSLFWRPSPSNEFQKIGV